MAHGIGAFSDKVCCRCYSRSEIFLSCWLLVASYGDGNMSPSLVVDDVVAVEIAQFKKLSEFSTLMLLPARIIKIFVNNDDGCRLDSRGRQPKCRNRTRIQVAIYMNQFAGVATCSRNIGSVSSNKSL